MFKGRIFLLQLVYRPHDITGPLEHPADFIKGFPCFVKIGLDSVGGNGLNPPDTRRNSSFGTDFEMPYIRGIRDMGPPAKFDGFPEADRAHPVPVFLPEQGHSALVQGFCYGDSPRLLKGQVFLDPGVDKILDFLQFGLGEFRKMREIKTKVFGVYG